MSCSLEETPEITEQITSCLIRNLFVCVSRGGASSETLCILVYSSEKRTLMSL
jgi:hypothetical protein